MPVGKRKRQAYDNAFKIRVIEYAEREKNNSAAEKEFGVSEKLVRDWLKNKEKIVQGPAHQKRKVIRISPYDRLEKDLLDWVLEQRQAGLAISRNAIRLKALHLAKIDTYGVDKSVFKASAGWCSRFMNRHGLCLQQKTHIAQKLPGDVDDKVSAFHQFVLRERKQFDYELGQIGNMDETPMFLDMPGSTTVNVAGEKTVSIRTTGSEKAHFTVILACLADGTKLKPAVVFKRKTMPKEKFPPGIEVYVQPKGWVDEGILDKWLDAVWFRRPGGLLKPRSIRVWDQFRVHLLESMKKRLRENNTRQAVIPGGCTSVLQPLDVALNKPFKVQVRHQWAQWMVNGPRETTECGNLKPPSLPLVCEWIISAWDSIPKELVMKSFLKCGISNSMVGTEDDALFDEFISGTASDDSTAPEKETDDADSVSELYDDQLTQQQMLDLFGSDDDESDFDGF